MPQFRRIIGIALAASLTPASSATKSPTWVEVRSPNFVVVSNAGEKQARNTALQFELIRAVFRQSVKGASAHPNPTVTVLAVKDAASMRALLPEYWTNGRPHPAGAFVSHLNQFFAVIDLSARGPNPYRTLYHEYYHAITVPYFPNMPLWLAEGMAEFYGHTQIQEKDAVVGQTDPILLQQLRNSTSIPLNVLFKVDRSSPYYNEESKTSLFYAESWALIHYLMVGDRTAHQAMLNAYLDALDEGKSGDEAASLAFGDLEKLQSDLRGYVKGNKFIYLEEPPAARIDESKLKVRSLSEAEAEAYQGGFAVVRNQLPDATAQLEDALQLDPNIALTYQYLAMCQFFDGHGDQALQSVSKAISLDPKNFFTHYLRALLDIKSTGLVPDDAQIEDDLRQAITISPEFAPAYALLATQLAEDEDTLAEALSLVQKAVASEPGNSIYQFDLAQVLLHMNKLDEAGAAAARALAWARTPRAKANAEDFLAQLRQARQDQSQMSSLRSADTLKVETPGTDDFSSLTHSTENTTQVSGSKPASAARPSVASMQMQASISILSNAFGFDFTPYLKVIVDTVRGNLAANVAQGHVRKQRSLSVEFVILKDGKITGVRISSGSGDAALDRASRHGVAASGPLPALPPGFKGQYLQLHLGLSYSPEG